MISNTSRHVRLIAPVLVAVSVNGLGCGNAGEKQASDAALDSASIIGDAAVPAVMTSDDALSEASVTAPFDAGAQNETIDGADPDTAVQTGTMDAAMSDVAPLTHSTTDAAGGAETGSVTSNPEDAGLDGAPPSSLVVTIGPAGGTIENADGVRIVIPAGALSENVDIGIAPSNQAELPAPVRGVSAAGKAFALTPHGQTFSAPVSVRIPFDTAAVPQPLEPILLTSSLTGAWSRVADVTVDARGALVANVQHFSQFQAGITLTFREIHQTCGLSYLGEIWCWGHLSSLSLSSPVPMRVTSSPQLESFAGDDVALCGIGPNRRVYCQGSNVGDGTGQDASTLVPVASQLSFAEVVAGGDHFCALADTTGSIWCWGMNSYGQLGTGDYVKRTTPTLLAGAAGTYAWMDLDAGASSSCAITQAGDLYCWGDNSYQELGLPKSVQQINTPTKVFSGALRVSTGGGSTCVVTGSGRGYCAGDNTFGQIGDGTKGVGESDYSNFTKTFTAIGGNLTWRVDTDGHQCPIATGPTTCGVTSSANTYCWGSSGLGAIGDGVAPNATATQVTPSRVAGGLNFQQLSTYSSAVLALTPERVAYSWGYNRFGELGQGSSDTDSHPTPERIKVTDLE